MSQVEPCKPVKDRLPFVVGISGNRDLGGMDRSLGDATAEYLRKFHEKYPRTPILVLSSLARGADQVIAASSLLLCDCDKDEIRHYVSLAAVLPMPDRLYRDDFVGERDREARDEYNRLKGLACRTIELPLVSPEAEVAPTDPHNDARNLQYLLAGVFIARRCHVLLSAWDGEPAHGIGGTAQIVQFKRSGRLDLPDALRERFDKAPDPFGYPPHPIEVPETGPVVIFPLAGGQVGECVDVMPRPLIAAKPTRKPVLTGAAYFDRLRNERVRARKAYFERFDRIHKGNLEDFNERTWKLEQEEAQAAARDEARAAGQPVGRLAGRKDKKIKRRASDRATERQSQLPDDESGGLPDSLPWLADAFAMVDCLAIDYQTKVNRLLVWGVTPITLGVAAFATYAHLAVEGPARYWFLVAFLGLLAISYTIYLGSHPRSRDFITRALPKALAARKSHRAPRHDDKNRYQDFRTIAEGLRVQLFWRLAGMPDFVSDYYLTRQKNEIDWIRVAIGSWGLLAKPATARIDLVRRRWVVSQLAYYIRSSYRDRISHLIYRQMAAGLIVAGLCVSLCLVGYHFSEAPPWHGWGPVRIFIYALFLFIGAPLLRYALAKWQETEHEVKEDEEEFLQNDRTIAMLIEKWGAANVSPPPPLPRSFLRPWFHPLLAMIWWWRGAKGRPRVDTDEGRRPWRGAWAWLIGSWKEAKGRLRVVRVANASFTVGFLLGVVITLILMAVSRVLPEAGHGAGSAILKGKDETVDWVIVGIAVSAAFAALFQWYSEKLALGEQYRQYKRTKMTFLLAHESLEPNPAGNPSTPASVIFKDLGRESLAEHADWLLLRRERPLELAWPPA